ncbi:MAG: sugar ABC transporter ATP-binding protein [Phycisphaerales bacterium JB037]
MIAKPDRQPARDPQEGFLVTRGISKRFGITRALDDVSVSLRAGEVHALMGENGAGKSTLGKVIAGLHKPDEGTVTLDGTQLETGSLAAAFAAGVRLVHQELAQCPNLSVAENLSLHDPPRGRFGLVDREAMRTRARTLLARLEPRIDVDAPIGSLSPGHRQICQIAAALDDTSEIGGSAPRVIVFDEPTSSLAAAEVDRLLEIVRELAAEGLCVVYVSHRMGEIFACCDRVTVLRDGKYVATSNITDISEADLVEQMIGRRLEAPAEPERSPGGPSPATRALAGAGATAGAGEVVLRVENLSSPGKLSGVSLSVHAGEIVGVGGLVGAGRSELLDAIFGLDRKATGTVEMAGRRFAPGKPRDRIAAGMGYVPEDRRWQGLFLDLGVDENTVVPSMPRLSGVMGVRNLAAERTLFSERRSTFQIKTATPASLPDELSGGNQQKLLIARWMGPEVKVLLLDEPTRGIDVGTKAEIYKHIRAAAARGVAVLLVSSEMPELLALSDRVIVLASGHAEGELAGEEMTQRAVLTLATREHH